MVLIHPKIQAVVENKHIIIDQSLYPYSSRQASNFGSHLSKALESISNKIKLGEPRSFTFLFKILVTPIHWLLLRNLPMILRPRRLLFGYSSVELMLLASAEVEWWLLLLSHGLCDEYVFDARTYEGRRT